MPLLSGPQQPPYVQLVRWIANPARFLETNRQRYGDIFAVAFPQPWVMVNHPAGMQQLLTRDTQEFSAPGEQNQILAPLLGHNSLILISGNRHRKRRQLLLPPFHGERLKAYADLIVQLTHEELARWPLQQGFEVRPAMQRISMRVILQAVFGLYAGERYQQLDRVLSQMLDMLAKPIKTTVLFFPVLQRDLGDWSLGGRLRKMHAEIDRLLQAEIAERRARPDPSRTDILSLLLTAKDENGEGMTYPELRDEMMTLLMAGHETTATALTWTLYWLHRLPEVRERLRQELAAAGEGADLMVRSQLPYLNAVCQEVLRIYPVAMLTFPRQVETPVTLLGHDLAPGTLVVGDIYNLHRRPELYPEPEQFQPQRFLDRQFSPYEYMPFGGGSRRCIGAGLARLELSLVTSTILMACDLAPANDRPAKPQRRGITLGPDQVKLRLMGRRVAEPVMV